MREKSIVPIVDKDGNGPNIDIGEIIIYETPDGQLDEAMCMGWRWNQSKQTYEIKTNKTHPDQCWSRLDVQMDKVWRAYDAKDEYIEKLQEELAFICKMLCDCAVPVTSDKSPSDA